ncbi:RHS repeat-associated core domain-containing protein [Streptomyces sp. NPDC016172]|uniref:RHS repeat-associated core domain-containing protein n=1 Tax=Streptomyces sp. NPDC016172 TaxID=3364964 RepID=UPI0036F66367
MQWTLTGGHLELHDDWGEVLLLPHRRTGNVLGLVDDAGKRTHTYAYGPTGLPRGTTTEAVPQPHRYTGAHLDPTGLYKMGHRYYDPTLGRFTQPDPSGQETNPYLYASGDPVNNVDPTGLFDWKSVAVAAGTAAGVAAAAVAVGAACGATAGAACLAAGAVTAGLWGGAAAGGTAAAVGAGTEGATLGGVASGLVSPFLPVFRGGSVG